MPVPLFPPRSGTFRRFRLPDHPVEYRLEPSPAPSVLPHWRTFDRQLSCRFSLQYPLEKQHCLLRGEVPPLKHRPAVHVVNTSAVLTAVHQQIARFRLPKPAPLAHACPTTRALHPLRVKVLLYPIEAHPSIHYVRNWKVHAFYCILSLVPNISRVRSFVGCPTPPIQLSFYARLSQYSLDYSTRSGTLPHIAAHIQRPAQCRPCRVLQPENHQTDRLAQPPYRLANSWRQRQSKKPRATSSQLPSPSS